MLHYGATSRSARIVVTLLHESLGPTTAGASLFWTPDSPPVRVGRQRCGASPVRALPRVKSQRRRQTLLSIPRLHAAWEIDRQAWRPSTSPILSRGPKRQARYNAAVRHDSGAHPDNPKERPDAQSHAHPCDRTAVRRSGGPHADAQTSRGANNIAGAAQSFTPVEPTACRGWDLIAGLDSSACAVGFDAGVVPAGK